MSSILIKSLFFKNKIKNHDYYKSVPINAPLNT